VTFGVMIDATGGSIDPLLAALGSNNPDTFATYVTGSDDVPATIPELADLATRAGLFKYDQSPALESFGRGLADGADIEANAGLFDNAVIQTGIRERRGWYSWWYFSASNLDHARQLSEENKFRRLRFIVANWALSQSQAEAFITTNTDVDAVQWASPSSNPHTVCPGTNRSLGELNIDLNVTRPAWFIKPVTVPVPVPKPAHRGILVSDSLENGALTTMAVVSNDGNIWTR
jgi:hypothetical protein